MTSQTPLAGSVRKDEIFLEVGTVAAKSKITKATSGHTTERFGKSKSIVVKAGNSQQMFTE
jgi:hypothetical protein